VIKRSYSFTCHPHVYPRMKWAILPSLPAAEQNLSDRTLAGTAVGLDGWLHTEVVCPRPKTVTHPNTNRAVVWPSGIELTTIESQVRRLKHLDYRVTFKHVTTQYTTLWNIWHIFDYNKLQWPVLRAAQVREQPCMTSSMTLKNM